ncbi:MAG TPA: hypothetical protein VFE26_10890 [Trebonia sp.]|jgi:hypothetical protein|nr:hypothetical protein [Trebonia sp.]
MAKHKVKHKKHSSALALYSARRARSGPKPIVIKQTKVIKHKAKRRSSGGGGGGLGLGRLISDQRIQFALGAAAVGVLEKQTFYAQVPALPYVGKKGTVAVAAFLLSDGGKNKLANDICTAALMLAAYELGSTGKVSGDDYIAGDDGSHIGYVAGY